MRDELPDFATWLRELVDGNEDAFEEFWSRYGSRLQQLASSHMTSALQRRVGADDIVQSVFRTFFVDTRKSELQLADSDSLWRLLCAITLAKVCHYARFHRRQRRTLDREESLEGGTAAGELMAKDDQPTPAEAAEFADQMQHFFDSLDRDEQQAVEYRLDGLSSTEIAAKMGRSERTVRRLIERVREHWTRELNKSIVE